MKAASLNHVYRLVWSKLQQAWVAVAETARAHGKSSVSGQTGTAPAANAALNVLFTQSGKWRYVVASAFAAMVMPLSSYAADTNVIAGVPVGDLTVKEVTPTQTQYIHTANVNIVDFYKFGVMKGHQLDVIMPDAGRALYRVIGNSRSEIMGTLNSNGSLFLINQNGVLFGQGSEVNVGNIVASTLNISNDDFLKGNYNFTVGSIRGDIENHGVIKAKNEGYIVLLGKTVDNSGTLVASNGSVVLGSAQAATLDFFGNGLVKVKLSGDALEATIKNSGNIYADGGFVQMATNARSAAINISGIVEANQLVEREGVIRLEGGDNAKVEVSGQLLAKGQGTTGGTIEVTGEQVALMNGALLDASGDTGGGTVLVGGDYQGKNDAVYNSRTTYVASGATIKADALQQGNGGKVVVWANDLTRYYGSISAQGGAASGNGGFVEVSGKQNLAFLGTVNVAAANGIGGTVLLDPETINLISGGSTPADNASGTPDVAFADNAGGTTNVNVAGITGFNELFLQATKDINVNAAVTMTNLAGNIRLEAGNDINVNAALTTTGTGSINLKADADTDGVGNLAIGANITGRGGVILSAATLTHTAGNISASGDITGFGHAGSVSITVAGLADLGSANITANGRSASSANNGFNGGSVVIKAGSLNMTGNIDTRGSASGTPGTGTSTPPLGTGGTGGKVDITTTGDAKVGNITTGAGNAGRNSIVSTTSGEVSVKSTSGNVTVGDVTTKGGFNSIGNKVTLSAANGSVTAGNIDTSAGAGRNNTDGKSAGAVDITAGTGITTKNITASGADGNGTNKSGGSAAEVKLQSTNGDVTVETVTANGGAKTGTGIQGNSKTIFIRAGNDVIQKGNIVTTSNSQDAVTLVAGRGYKNTGNFGITTGASGRWLIYSASPDVGQRGTQIYTNYDFKQYGTTYDGVKGGTEQINAAATGNGLIYSEKVAITPTLEGSVTKVYDTTTVADISGLSLVSEGRDGDVVKLSDITSANYDNKNVGVDKLVTTNPLSIVSVKNTVTRGGVEVQRSVYGYTLATDQASGNVGTITRAPVTVSGITANDKFFDNTTAATVNTGPATINGVFTGDQLAVVAANGQFQDSAVGNGKPVLVSGITLGGIDVGNYELLSNTGETTASILALPVTPPTTVQNISPRDNAGLGGLIPNNPILNTMFIVSLNPAAGDEEDLDAVACPTNEDSLGSTPILSSGVKLPDGVNSNCI